MNSQIKGANSPVDTISTEDVDFIRTMVALPKENKILARGIILGLGLAGQVGSVDGLLINTGQDSA